MNQVVRNACQSCLEVILSLALRDDAIACSSGILIFFALFCPPDSLPP